MPKWWDDEFVPYDDDGPLVRVGGRTIRKWPKRVVFALAGFWMRNWQFILGFIVSLGVLWCTYLSLLRP